MFCGYGYQVFSAGTPNPNSRIDRLVFKQLSDTELFTQISDSAPPGKHVGREAGGRGPSYLSSQ